MLLFEEDEGLGTPTPCWSFALSDTGPPDDDEDEQSDPGGDSDPEPADLAN